MKITDIVEVVDNTREGLEDFSRGSFKFGAEALLPPLAAALLAALLIPSYVRALGHFGWLLAVITVIAVYYFADYAATAWRKRRFRESLLFSGLALSLVGMDMLVVHGATWRDHRTAVESRAQTLIEAKRLQDGLDDWAYMTLAQVEAHLGNADRELKAVKNRLAPSPDGRGVRRLEAMGCDAPEAGLNKALVNLCMPLHTARAELGAVETKAREWRELEGRMRKLDLPMGTPLTQAELDAANEVLQTEPAAISFSTVIIAAMHLLVFVIVWVSDSTRDERRAARRRRRAAASPTELEAIRQRLEPLRGQAARSEIDDEFLMPRQKQPPT